MSAPLTPERLAEYAALEQDATQGPWRAIIDPSDDGFPAGAIGVATEDETFVFAESVTDGVEILRADAKFTAAARTAVPELLAEVDRLREFERRVTDELEVFEESARKDPETPRAALFMISLLRNAVAGDPR